MKVQDIVGIFPRHPFHPHGVPYQKFWRNRLWLTNIAGNKKTELVHYIIYYSEGDTGAFTRSLSLVDRICHYLWKASKASGHLVQIMVI